MNLNEKKLRHEILSEMSKNRVPMGASMLALIIDTSQATIGRQLQQLEFEGYLNKHSNKGRTITEEGIEYLNILKNDIESDKKAQRIIEFSRDSSRDRILDVLRTRKILERETVKEAVERMTDEDIDDLEEYINAHEIKVMQGMLGEEEDLKIHSFIASKSGNSIIEEILSLILKQGNTYSKLSIIRRRMSHSVSDHKIIFEAIRNRDSELAQSYMVQHLDNIIADVEHYFENNENQEKNDII